MRGDQHVVVRVATPTRLNERQRRALHEFAAAGGEEVGETGDGNFFENFACGSSRNYGGYCNEQVQKMIDAQSQELDPKKRLTMVVEIQKKLEEDAARPTVDWRLEYYLQWQHVKNLIPHQSIYNWGRMQEVWLDR